MKLVLCKLEHDITHLKCVHVLYTGLTSILYRSSTATESVASNDEMLYSPNYNNYYPVRGRLTSESMGIVQYTLKCIRQENSTGLTRIPHHYSHPHYPQPLLPISPLHTSASSTELPPLHLNSTVRITSYICYYMGNSTLDVTSHQKIF